MIKVLIVDDHALFRQSIAMMLSSVKDVSVVGSASSGEEALKLVEQTLPNVILMDVRMPGIGGLGATKKILHIAPEAKVVGVSGYNDGAYPGLFIRAGASGYITKESDVHEIQTAIQTVHNGETYLSNSVAERVANQRESSASNPFDELAERELQVALLIAESYHMDDMVARLNISERSIRSYRARAFKKLAVESDVELTLLALRCGMVIPENINRPNS